jgi:hypothetical protein
MSLTGATRRPARTEQERAAHLIDVGAIRRALLGTPTALRELERGAVVTLCDVDGIDRHLVAGAMQITKPHLEILIRRRRDALPAAQADFLAACMREPAQDLVEAVHAGDRDAVAGVLEGLDVQSLYALAVVLADLVDPAVVARDPGADDALPTPP